MKITWTNCSDEMPYGYNRCIIKLTHNNELFIIRPEWFVFGKPYMWHWTPYTPEKWKELNK